MAGCPAPSWRPALIGKFMESPGTYTAERVRQAAGPGIALAARRTLTRVDSRPIGRRPGHSIQNPRPGRQPQCANVTLQCTRLPSNARPEHTGISRGANAVIVAVVSAAMLQYLAGLIAIKIAKSLRRIEPRCRTIRYEGRMQNCGLGIAFALKFFSPPRPPPNATLGLAQYSPASAAAYWAGRP